MAYDEEFAERVRALAAPGAVERKMFGGLGWMINGNMAYGVMSQGGLLVRVDPAAAPEMLREPNVREFGREGAKPMSGFVIVDADDNLDDAELAYWMNVGAERATSLPPK